MLNRLPAASTTSLPLRASTSWGLDCMSVVPPVPHVKVHIPPDAELGSFKAQLFCRCREPDRLLSDDRLSERGAVSPAALSLASACIDRINVLVLFSQIITVEHFCAGRCSDMMLCDLRNKSSEFSPLRLFR